jgi:hypothetical protein
VALPEAGWNSHSSSVPGRQSQAELSIISPRLELSFISPRPSLPGRNSQNSSVPSRHSQAGTLRTPQSPAVIPRPELLKLLSPRTLSHQSSLPRSLLGGTLSISRPSQSGGCTESACTNIKDNVGIENCVKSLYNIYILTKK